MSRLPSVRPMWIASLLVAVTAVQTFGVPAATQPSPEVSSRANALLDVAADALNAWQPDASTPMPAITPFMTAMNLVYARGSAEDRKAAERYLTLAMPARAGQAEKSRLSSETQAKFWLRAALVDAETLKPEVASYEQAMRAAAPPGQPFPSPMDVRLGEAYGLIGDMEASAKYASQCYPAIASAMDEAGKSYPSEAFEKFVERDIADQQSFDAVVAIRSWADLQADEGWGTLGQDALEKIKMPRRRFDALCEFALRCADLGKDADAQSAFDAASEMTSADDFGVPGNFSYAAYVDDGQQKFAKELYDDVRDSALAWKPEETPPDNFAHFAIGAAIFNDAEAATAASKGLQACVEAESEVDAKANLTFFLAAIARQRGQDLVANAMLSKGLKLAPNLDVCSTPGFVELVHATMRKQSPKDGLKLAASSCKTPEFLDSERRTAINLLARSGKYGDAWDLAGEMAGDSLLRVICEMHILIAMERAGEYPMVLMFLSSTEDRGEAAMLALYTARDLLGTRGFGTGGATVWK